ncbi:MAG: EAL domain-containing protein [Gaiellaceae bacterium]
MPPGKSGIPRSGVYPAPRQRDRPKVGLRNTRGLAPVQPFSAAASEERLAALLELLPATLLIVSSSGRVELVSTGVFALTEYPASDFMAGVHSLDELVLPDDRDELEDALAAAATTHEGYEVDYRITTARGETRWVHERGRFERGARVAVLVEETERKGRDAERDRERAMLDVFFETTSDNVYFKDLESRFLKVSAAQATWLGLKCAAEAVGKSDADFFGEEHAAGAYGDEQEIIRTGKPIIDFEEADTWKDGRTAWVSTTKMPLRDQHGEVIGTFGISRDITKRKLAEFAFQRQQQRMATIIETQRDVAVEVGELPAALRIVAERAQQLARAEAAVLLLREGGDLVVRSCSGTLDCLGLRLESAGLFGDCLAQAAPLCRTGLEPEDVPLPGSAAVSIAAVPIRYNNGLVGVLGVVSTAANAFEDGDVESLQLLGVVIASAMGQDDLRKYAALQAHQALHDGLTGLPNRTLFYDRIRQALLAAERDGGRIAVAIMDLDRFKEINDTLGHAAGDHVLREIGRRLQTSLRASDTVARLGGDEYGLLLPKQADSFETAHLMEKLVAAIAPPIDLEELPLSVEGSIGLAFYPDHGLDVEELVQRADVAMYMAKQQGLDYAFYEQTSDSHDPIRLTLIGELRTAIDNRDLKLHYQPKASLSDGHSHSVEALLRWYHPERGLIPPMDFIPAAQETGLMKPLTLYVLDEALAQLRRWDEQGLELTVSVNLATRNLIDSSFPDDVAEALERHSVPPARLELEITESTVLDDPGRTLAVLERLDAMGVKLSVDDFGTGYSSLSYLRRLPVSEIKIDRSFVMRMADDAGDEAIVRSTIELGRNLGLNVVAEGVESEEAWKRLNELGCDFAQGFWLSKPMPADDVASWFAGHSQGEGTPPAGA